MLWRPKFLLPIASLVTNLSIQKHMRTLLFLLNMNQTNGNDNSIESSIIDFNLDDPIEMF